VPDAVLSVRTAKTSKALSCAGADTTVVVVVLEVCETGWAKGEMKGLVAGPLVTTVVVVVVAGTLLTTGCEVVSAVLPDGTVPVQAARAASVMIGSSCLADRIFMVVVLCDVAARRAATAATA
jgi:hypothetical protein